MLRFFKSITLCIVLIYIETDYLYAKSGSSSPEENNIDQAILELQEQIESLQTEINQSQQEAKTGSSSSSSNKINQSQLEANPSNSSYFSMYSSVVNRDDDETSKNPLDKYLIETDSIDLTQNISSEGSIIDLGKEPIEGVFNKSGGINVGDAPPVTSGGEVAFIGAYSGNNTVPIGMISSTLFASTIMGQRDRFDDYSIFLGGFINMDAQTWFGSSLNRVDFDGNPTTPFPGNGQNVYLTSATLYFLANVGNYVTASYDVSTSETGEFFINNAFAMFGNMTISPFFVTAGRSPLTVAAFGGGGPYTGSIADYLGVGRATNVSINYKTDTINASMAVFGADDQQADFSAGLFYADSWTEDLSVGFNTGYVYNLDGAENFSIPLAAPGKTIGVYNVDTNIAYAIGGGNLQGNVGWATSTNAADFNGTGNNVLTGAWYIATNYSLTLGGRGTNFGVSYGQSYNAAAVPMPISGSPFQEGFSQSGIHRQLIFSAQRAYFDDMVIFSPEWAYQKYYDGSHMNTLTLDVAVYI